MVNNASNNDILAQVHHDLTGAIRNFSVAKRAFESASCRSADALELLNESILQLQKIRDLLARQMKIEDQEEKT